MSLIPDFFPQYIMQQNLSDQGQEAWISYGYGKLNQIEKSITETVRSTIRDEINCTVDKLKKEFTEATDCLAAEQGDMKGDIKILVTRFNI